MPRASRRIHCSVHSNCALLVAVVGYPALGQASGPKSRVTSLVSCCNLHAVAVEVFGVCHTRVISGTKDMINGFAFDMNTFSGFTEC